MRETEVVKLVTSAPSDRNDVIDVHSAPKQLRRYFDGQWLAAKLALGAVSAEQFDDQFLGSNRLPELVTRLR